MAWSCFGLDLRRRQLVEHKATNKTLETSHICKVSKDVPRESIEKEALRKSLSVASCSISVVGVAEEQDPLHLNIPFVPASGHPFKRPSSPLGKTFSQELPHVHLPRTHASKEEVSSLGCAELASMDRDRQRMSLQLGIRGSSTGQDSTGSLDSAANLVLAQLEPLLESPADMPAEEPTSVLNSRSVQSPEPVSSGGSPVVHSPEPASSHNMFTVHSAEPDIRALCQDWGSITSPFALQASQGTLLCSSQASTHRPGIPEEGVEPTSSSKREAATPDKQDVNLKGASTDHHQEASAVQGDAALRLAAACSGRRGEHNHPPSPIRSCPSGCGSNSVSTELVSNMAQPKLGGIAAAAARIPIFLDASPSDCSTAAAHARAQRRRTRQHTDVQPDQENRLHIEKAIPEDSACPELTLQKPLESTTNMSSHGSKSLDSEAYHQAKDGHVGCNNSLEQHQAHAVLGSVTIGIRTFKQPAHRMKALRPLTMLPAPAILLSRRMRASLGSQASSSGILTGEDSRDAARAEDPGADSQSRHTSGGLSSHRQKTEAAGPAYMNSTASVRAKADSAEQQLKACRAARHAVRRWSY